MRKIIAMGMALIMFVTIFAIVVPMSAGQSSSSVTRSNPGGCNILITDTGNNRVIEVDDTGTIVWQITGLNYPFDAERLDNGNTLITDTMNNRIIEVAPSGMIVWQKTGVMYPMDAERLDNGNTLIADYFMNRVIEINSAGSIVWQKTGVNMPVDVERLDNGNTLIVEGNRVIEVNSAGTVLWQYSSVNYPYDAERLDNGNTLIADMYNFRVIEVDSSGSLIWQWRVGWPMYIQTPSDVEPLEDGSTLITMDYSMLYSTLIEIDSSRNVVWQYAGSLSMPYDAEILDSAITADVRVEPQSLNLNSMGNYVNVKVEGFPDNPEYIPLDVDGTSVLIEGISCESKYGTWNEDKYITKADRLLIEDAIGAPGDEIELEVTGKLIDGTKFRGTAIIEAHQNL